MSLALNIQNAFTRVSTELRALRSLLTGSSTGDLSGLNTATKTSIVAAINEVATSTGATNLDQLTDVAITAPADGDILRRAGAGFVNVPGTTYFQPRDSDLDAIAALTTTAWGRALLALADAAALTNLVVDASEAVKGKVALASVTDATAGLDASKAVTPAGLSAALNALVAGAPGLLNTLDEIAAALGDDPNFAATMTSSLAGKQPLDADLTAIAGLASAADTLPYATGPQAWSLTTLTSFARSLLDDTSPSVARTTLDVYSKAEIGDPETDFVAAFNSALTA